MEDKSLKKLPLIIFLDDDNSIIKTYSMYEIKDGYISFSTHSNKLTIPLTRLIKIKEEGEE